MQKIVTFLAFNDQAEEAVNFYVSIIKNSKIISITRSTEDGSVKKDKLINITFELDGQKFMAIDGGSYFTFSQGMSLVINCETQEEIDEVSEKFLASGGEQLPCGWVKDSFGVSWQIVPTTLMKLMTGASPSQSKHIMDAVLKMKRLNIQELEAAYNKE